MRLGGHNRRDNPEAGFTNAEENTLDGKRGNPPHDQEATTRKGSKLKKKIRRTEAKRTNAEGTKAGGGKETYS